MYSFSSLVDTLYRIIATREAEEVIEAEAVALVLAHGGLRLPLRSRPAQQQGPLAGGTRRKKHQPHRRLHGIQVAGVSQGRTQRPNHLFRLLKLALHWRNLAGGVQLVQHLKKMGILGEQRGEPRTGVTGALETVALMDGEQLGRTETRQGGKVSEARDGMQIEARVRGRGLMWQREETVGILAAVAGVPNLNCNRNFIHQLSHRLLLQK